jgi:hypothetical protein
MSTQASEGSANLGGRGKRGIMDEVATWRQEGHTEKDIRDKLKARNYQAPRIAQLLKSTKASAAVSGMMPAPPPAVESSPAPPVRAERSEANSPGPCQSYGKMRRGKSRAPNPF